MNSWIDGATPFHGFLKWLTYESKTSHWGAHHRIILQLNKWTTESTLRQYGIEIPPVWSGSIIVGGRASLLFSEAILFATEFVVNGKKMAIFILPIMCGNKIIWMSSNNA